MSHVVGCIGWRSISEHGRYVAFLINEIPIFDHTSLMVMPLERSETTPLRSPVRVLTSACGAYARVWQAPSLHLVLLLSSHAE